MQIHLNCHCLQSQPFIDCHLGFHIFFHPGLFWRPHHLLQLSCFLIRFLIYSTTILHDNCSLVCGQMKATASITNQLYTTICNSCICTRVICLICTPMLSGRYVYTQARGPLGPRAWVYISGRSRGHVIQLICTM